MRTHTTTSNSWHLVPKLNTSFNTMKKDLTTTIEGCPYDINLEVVLTLNELHAMGFDHNSEEEIAYDLGANECEKEMQVNFKLWDFIAAVNRSSKPDSRIDTQCIDVFGNLFPGGASNFQSRIER